MSSSACSSRFRQLPPNIALAHFLSKHDNHARSGFITRLDRSTVKHKKLTFAKALVLNLVVLAFLAGLSAFTIIRHALSTSYASSRVSILLTQDFLIAAAAFVLARTTTVPFFLGECRLRLRNGFHPSEIVIRRPPVTGSSARLDATQKEDQRLERYWRMATRAVNPNLLYSSASALFSPEYWTVEYAAVFDALKSIARGDFSEEALEFAVWKQDGLGVWTCCELWRMHEIMNDQQEIAMFKTFLTQSGKQDLLAIWQEMLSTPPASQIAPSPSPKAYQALVDEFAREGLDYETVWSQVSEKASLL